jgi:proteasome lid subunit RPN8/RPN11
MSDPLFQELLESTLLDEVAQHAKDAYPSEACGVILSEENGLRLLRFENIQDKLHAIDPERFPRTSTTAYNMNTLKLHKLWESDSLRIIYHSHVEFGAYFSDEDHAGALTPDTQEPVFPGVDYLVFSLIEQKSSAAGLFRFSETSRRYDSVDRMEYGQ